MTDMPTQTARPLCGAGILWYSAHARNQPYSRTQLQTLIPLPAADPDARLPTPCAQALP